MDKRAKKEHARSSSITSGAVANSQFADKVAKLREIKAKQTLDSEREDHQQPVSFRMKPITKDELTASIDAKESPRIKLEHQKNLQNVRRIENQYEIDIVKAEAVAMRNQRSSSVSSQKKKMYMSFQKDTSKSNLVAGGNNKISSRNIGAANTTNQT